MGVQNSDLDAQGAVTWSRVATGVDGQQQAFALEAAAKLDGDRFTLTAPGAFDTRYSVYRATNLMEPFVCVISNAPCLTSPVLVTDDVSEARAFYRMEYR